MLEENGTERRRLLKYLENGKDVTKKRRKQFEGKGWDDDGDEGEVLDSAWGETVAQPRLGLRRDRLRSLPWVEN